MKIKCLGIIGLSLLVVNTLTACSKSGSTNSVERKMSNNGAMSKDLIRIDLGADIATLDPQKSEDVSSSRVMYDLFEGLMTQNQKNQAIPGLASEYKISPDGKTYTFTLRPQIKFSNGAPITTSDVVYTFRRLADPKTASTYNFLVSNIVNGQAIIDNKKPVSELGVKALNANSIQIQLVHFDPSFLDIVAMPNLAIVSKDNLIKYGEAWTNPKNMVTSGAYKLDEYVVNGHILETKNPYYYLAKEVAIDKVKLFPIVDTNTSYSMYQSGGLDLTYKLPVDQYKEIKASYPKEEHTVSWETIEYLDFNMQNPKFKDNLNLRKALSIAVDREALVKDVLGQEQKPLYAYVTNTVENGKFKGLDYSWSKLPREEQIAMARDLFKKAGYSDENPLQITITYNTNDAHRKKALAIASMWQSVFGPKAIQVIQGNQEWKTFLQTRHKGDYDIARDGWVADYNSVDSYSQLYFCGGPQNNAHSCTPGFNELVLKAQLETKPEARVDDLKAAFKLAQDNYVVIPLFQDTYYRLVSPRVENYAIDDNHLDHVMSKWLKLK